MMFVYTYFMLALLFLVYMGLLRIFFTVISWVFFVMFGCFLQVLSSFLNLTAAVFPVHIVVWVIFYLL